MTKKDRGRVPVIGAELREELAQLRKEMATKEELAKTNATVREIALQVVKNSEAIESLRAEMVTKREHREVMETLDKMMAILRRLDEERYTMNQRVGILESDVAHNKVEIKVNREEIGKVKNYLKI